MDPPPPSPTDPPPATQYSRSPSAPNFTDQQLPAYHDPAYELTEAEINLFLEEVEGETGKLDALQEPDLHEIDVIVAQMNENPPAGLELEVSMKLPILPVYDDPACELTEAEISMFLEEFEGKTGLDLLQEPDVDEFGEILAEMKEHPPGDQNPESPTNTNLPILPAYDDPAYELTEVEINMFLEEFEGETGLNLLQEPEVDEFDVILAEMNEHPPADQDPEFPMNLNLPVLPAYDDPAYELTKAEINNFLEEVEAEIGLDLLQEPDVDELDVILAEMNENQLADELEVAISLAQELDSETESDE